MGRPKKPKARDLTGLDSIEAVEEKLREVRATRVRLEGEQLHGSLTAICTLHRIELDCVKAIARLRAAVASPTGDDLSDMSEEELRAEAEELLARNGPTPLRVVGKG